MERCVRVARKSASDQDQVGALRQQVDSLSQKGAGLAGDAGRKATEAAAASARVAQEQTKALASVVRRQPLVALLVGIGLGYFLGRLISSIRWRQSSSHHDDRAAGHRAAPDRRSGATRRLAELAVAYAKRRQSRREKRRAPQGRSALPVGSGAANHSLHLRSRAGDRRQRMRLIENRWYVRHHSALGSTDPLSTWGDRRPDKRHAT
jgi:hypothetical protein